jgi:hypothetical protein
MLRSVRRRYSVLLALRFVPTGLSVTVYVLFLQQRGLSLAEIGVGTAAQGFVMLFLELPSGGLADALGRRPVLLLAGVFGLASATLLLAVHSVAMLALVATLYGIFRALDSGPLEAWFVDASHRADPEFDVERGLARGTVVICASIGAGALLSSGLVAVGGIAGIDELVAPLVLAIAVQVVSLVAVAALMHEVGRGRGWPAVRTSVRSVPAVVGDAMRVIRRSGLLAALVAAELLWGFGMVAFEVLMPPRLVEVTGDVDRAARVLGPSITFAWVLSALGAAAAPWLVRRLGSGPAGCALRVLHGLAVAAIGLVSGVVGVVTAYLANYWAHGATAPVHYGMVHRNVTAAHRATVVSANSLTSHVGFAIGGIALGALADAASITTAIVAGGAVLAAAGPLYLVRARVAPAVEGATR